MKTQVTVIVGMFEQNESSQLPTECCFTMFLSASEVCVLLQQQHYRQDVQHGRDPVFGRVQRLLLKRRRLLSHRVHHGSFLRVSLISAFFP